MSSRSQSRSWRYRGRSRPDRRAASAVMLPSHTVDWTIHPVEAVCQEATVPALSRDRDPVDSRLRDARDTGKGWTSDCRLFHAVRAPYSGRLNDHGGQSRVTSGQRRILESLPRQQPHLPNRYVDSKPALRRQHVPNALLTMPNSKSPERNASRIDDRSPYRKS